MITLNTLGSKPKLVRGRNELGDFANFTPHNYYSFLAACRSLNMSRSETESAAYKSQAAGLIDARTVMRWYDDETL